MRAEPDPACHAAYRGPGRDADAWAQARPNRRRRCNRCLRPVPGAFLGIDRPTVPWAQAVYPVLSSRPAVRGPFSGSDDAADTTGAFDSDLLPPKRIQASFIYRRTDAMQFSGMDSALRMALNSGLQEKLDLDLIAGTDGLLTGSNLGNHNVTSVTTFQHYLSQLSFQPRRWPVCGHEVGYPGADGLRDLRARGRRLPVQRVQVGAVSARTGVGRRARVGSRARPWRAIVRTRWYGSGCGGTWCSRCGAR